MTDTAVACTLTDAQLRERRSGILAQLGEAVVERHTLPHGITFRFDPDADTLARIAELIELERQCCAFLRFRLTIEPAQGPVWLELTGPPGAAEFLAGFLGAPPG